MTQILFSAKAKEQFEELKRSNSKKSVLKAVLKTLGMMEQNLRHPSLATHEFKSKKGPQGEKVFEAYAQNSAPGAYRIFWCYGPQKDQITILAIIPHP